MELRDYLRILRKNWVLIIIVMLAGVATSATYSMVQTPEYRSASKVFVSTSSGQSVQDLAQGSNFTVQRVKTYTDLVSTPIVLLPAIAALDLEMTSEQLSRQISATAALDTTIIEIAVVGPDPVGAANIANAVAESLADAVDDIERPVDAEAASPVRLTLVQQAEVPNVPVSPNTRLNLLIGLFAGTLAALGLAVLREALDNRVHNERDVTAITTAPIIGGIAFDPKASTRPLIVHADPRSPRAESFRTLRTNLSFLDFGSKAKAFVVTSSIQSEGKSTTAANLAISMADSGARVLLVDADLRRPKVADYMNLEGAVGLTDVLIGRAELLDVVQPWGRAKLFVLPAGKIPPNPSELLGSVAMAKLIEIFKVEFDAVIFDAPPLLPVTDAAILAKGVGGAIVVVAAGRTHKNQLRGAVSALENVGSPVLGIVLTMLPTKGPDAYGYGRYGQTYGYESSTREPAEAAIRGK